MPESELLETAAPTRFRLHDWVVLYRGRTFSLVTFGLFAALGGTVSGWATAAHGLQRGLPMGGLFPAFLLACCVTLPLGSRLLSAAHDPQLLTHPLKALLKPGFDFQGGAIFGALSLAGLAMVWDVPVLVAWDCLAIAVPIGHWIGRLGCFTYGCCHGAPTDAPWSVVYTHPESKAVWHSKVGGVPVHPTQLYSAAGNLTLAAFMEFALRDPFPGLWTATYLVAGAIGRVCLEFLRGEPSVTTRDLTSYQWIALAQGLAGLALLWVSRGEPPAPLTMGLGESFVLAAHDPAPLVAMFVGLFLAFGLHGRRIGSWNAT